MTSLFTPYIVATAAAPEGASWWDTIVQGGTVGFIILVLSIVALVLVLIHFVQIRRQSLLPPGQLEELDLRLTDGNVDGAAAYCLDPGNDSFLTRIMAAGLLRYQRSAFGVFEIKSAVEEAGDEQTARLYRATDALGLIGTIAPLLGLLGTVIGMVGAFDSVAHSAGSDSEALAGNISLALVTTLMGLTLAIPCVALFTYFRNRIDALAADGAREIERLLIHLESSTAPVSETGSGGSDT
ncbi:MAG: MotA/TolQ/ExbB proton channel family protein [Planctomycetota bacterium]|nr:MotA/TolQ/ExbB proton channel family protein [Planctomycetota bacterium]